MARRHTSKPIPLDHDLSNALRTVRLAFGPDQVTILSLVPNTPRDHQQLLADVDVVAGQVMPYYLLATLFEDSFEEDQ
jgi:hypothetical protein